MSVRKTTMSDLPRVLSLYESARSFMRSHDNPAQWGASGPGNDKIIRDIENGDSYVLYDEEGIYAVFSAIVGDDPTYRTIRGSWMSESIYVTIHRAASNGRKKGCMKEMVAFAETLSPHIRVDTHENNRTMINALISLGFSFRGTINVDDGSERRAYERIGK